VHRRQDEVCVELQGFRQERAFGPATANQPERQNATAVVEVLPKKPHEREVVRVMDDRRGDMRERESVCAPAIAKLLILGGRARNGRPESADGTKEVGRERDVVRREEWLEGAAGAVVFVNELRDMLARGRIRIRGQRVLHTPAEQSAIVPLDLAHECEEPVGSRRAIVVDKREKPPPGDSDAGIAGGGRPRVRLPNQTHVQMWRRRCDEGVERFGSAIVHDDHFEGEGRGLEAGDRVKAPAELCRAREGRHDNGDGRRVSHGTLREATRD
jgi:hypothetical protein